MSQKKILEICLSPDLGGLELFMVSCYDYFKTKTGCQIVVAPKKKLDNYIESDEKFYLKRNKFFPIVPALKLAKFIDEHKIDIVHFHWTRDIATVVLAKTLSKRKPKIMQTRNMTMTRFKDDIYHKWLYKNIDTLHAVTYQVKEQLERFIPQDVRPKIKVVYMGTDEPKEQKERVEELREIYALGDSFVVGIVGRIEEGKGQYLVLEAIARLKELDIKALIVGHTMDDGYLNTLKQKVKDLGIEDRVVFTGFTKEVNAHMSLCSAVVLGTKQETFGLVVIEAMVNRVTVIATNKGGPLEIIEHKKDGLLFDRSSEDLAKNIELLYRNPKLNKQLALAGYKKARDMFDAKTQLERLLGVIYES